jgi:3-demethoxyubiquinol 3-hydroxylase
MSSEDPQARAELARCPGLPNRPSLTVFYDGACPLCRREIGVYRNLQPLQGDASIGYADVSDTTLPLPVGTSQTQLLSRFHVQHDNGELISGAKAFIALWSALPGWRWLGLLGRLTGAALLMEGFYRFFLRARPMLQRLASRLERRNG